MNSLPSNEKSFNSDLLNKIPTGIIVLDRHNNNQPVFANKKFRKDLQLDDDQELTIEFLANYLDPSNREKFIEGLSSEILPEISDWKSIPPTGKITWVQFRVSPLNDNYYIVVVKNVGKVKETLDELLATEAQYQALLEKDPNFVFILKNGSLEYYNHAFIEKLGYTTDEVEQRGTMPTFFVAPEDRKKIARFLIQSKRMLITGDVPEQKDGQDRFEQPDENTEFDLLCKNGSRIPVHAIVRRIYVKKDVIIQGVLIDMSSIKELHDKKLDFLTLTQHQLRTPIVNLKGYLDFYKKQLKEGISSEDKQALETRILDVFSRNIDQMVSLIEALNDIELIRQGKLKCNLRGENFNQIIQRVIDDLDILLRRYRIDLIIEIPSTPFIMNLDRIRMMQAIRNIIENAIRFTGRGFVEITFSLVNDNQYLKLTIKDNGVGIDSSNLKDVGKPFMTFHPSASRLGLGIYLTKEIIEAHDGIFEITSSGFNQGTTVTITLPLLVSPDIETVSSQNKEDDSLKEIIEIVTTSDNILKRMDAVRQLGNSNYTGTNLDLVISTLEKVILYDKDRTIRNLAGSFYSQKVESKKKLTSDVA